MRNQNIPVKIHLGLGVLVLGVALGSVPAFAQEVWQTYPMTISTPAFGPGHAQSFAAPTTRPARRGHGARLVYNSAARAELYQGGRACEVWQTYPMTVSTAAFGHYDASCEH